MAVARRKPTLRVRAVRCAGVHRLCLGKAVCLQCDSPTPSASTRRSAGTANESYSYQRVDLCHYGIELGTKWRGEAAFQRWLVVYSDAAFKQAEKTLAKTQAKEHQKVQKQLFHLQAQRFDSQEVARMALDKITQKLNYHQVTQFSLTRHVQYARKGRPTAETPIKDIQWQIS